MLFFRNTLEQNLSRIIAIERADDGWINPWPAERHRASLADESERHVSVFRQSDEELIGFLILQQVDSPDRALEFRRIVLADKGKGYGRACLRWIKRFCFEELRFHRLWFDVYADNERAIRLYESEGFRREGTLREAKWANGRFRSIHLYSMLETEYETEKPKNRLTDKPEKCS